MDAGDRDVEGELEAVEGGEKLLLFCCDESCGSGVDGEATGDVFVGTGTGVGYVNEV